MTTSFDWDFRPERYWDAEEAIFANIKGTFRRQFIENAEQKGLVEALPEDFLTDDAGDAGREFFASAHPGCMSGEYLPDYHPGEVEIVRIYMPWSVLGDVTCLRARPDDGGIAYRVVGEHDSSEYPDEHVLPFTRTEEPLTFKQLVELLEGYEHYGNPFFDDEWGHIAGEAYDSWDSLQGWLDVSSAFYPEVTRWHDESWGARCESFWKDHPEQAPDWVQP